MQPDLVRRAKEGDHDALSVPVVPQIGRLHGLAGLILRDPSRAEDAVQEALLKAWRDLPRLRDVERFDAWLRRLLVNACRDEGRRLGRRGGETALAPQAEPAMSDGLEGVARRDELGRAFRHLTEEERPVIVMRYYLDLSGADAAAALGMRLIYRSRLHRALRALSAALAADARGAVEARGSSA